MPGRGRAFPPEVPPRSLTVATEEGRGNSKRRLSLMAHESEISQCSYCTAVGMTLVVVKNIDGVAHFHYYYGNFHVLRCRQVHRESTA